MATKQTETTKKNGKADAPATALTGPTTPVVGGKQTHIPGTEPNANVPKNVIAAAEKLRKAFNAEKSARQATADARGNLELLMKENEVPRVEIVDDEGDRVAIWVDVKSKVKMKVVEED